MIPMWEYAMQKTAAGSERRPTTTLPNAIKNGINLMAGGLTAHALITVHMLVFWASRLRQDLRARGVVTDLDNLC